MPELPEVETMRRGILGAEGGKVVSIEKIRCLCKSIEIKPSVSVIRRRIVGKKIDEIGRIGKRVVVKFVGGDSLVFEPRMTGIVLTGGAPTEKHLRFRINVAGADVSEIAFWDRRGLGKICLYSPEALDEKFGADKIGPDALKVTAQEFMSRFKRLNREIKVALLDQKIIAGVGNLYASEMLHVAKLNPQKKCSEVSSAAYTRLHSAMVKILNEAIRYEGSTLSDGTYRTSLNKDGSYQNKHLVYDRAGKKCLQCKKSEIIRIVQTQRSTFFCERCQRTK